MQVPGTWDDNSEGRLADYDGFAWYRAQVRVPTAWKDRKVELLLSQIDDAYEAYFDGVKIGAAGSFPPTYASGLDDIKRFPVPSENLRPGELHWVALRVYDHGGRGGFKGPVPVLTTRNEAVQMRGGWEFRTGDDLAWAKPAEPAIPANRSFEDILRTPEIVQSLLSKLSVGGALSPSDSLASFTVPADLALDQVLHEPTIEQPVFVNFDERGRLWVVEYRQYPHPAGVKMLSRDKFWRAVYDKVPPPPPNHFPGKDRITIHEDTDGDGTLDSHKIFLDGLNIVSAVERGRGGVWVLNPPYLLFYPDTNRDDIPDADPVVHLAGFGLEDTHSVVNSLCWGPDGWLYGAQGSTVTARVVRPGLDQQPISTSMGQLIWRYHPEKRLYEIFAEGGGNAFGCEFDSLGRVYSGHNGGDTRGFHYVQGGYYQKGFTKHGPLSNPFSFGFFKQMDSPPLPRFTHNFIIYAGGSLPPAYDGLLMGVSPLENFVVSSRLIPQGSTFRTEDVGHPITTTDGFFKPVDIKVGPDGAVYVADWYDFNVNHYRNHEGNIDPASGRVYRLRNKSAKPSVPRDLSAYSSEKLVTLLSDPNEWTRQTARRLLADRQDRSVLPQLRQLFRQAEPVISLEALWALYVLGDFDEPLALEALGHRQPSVRRWGVRLIGDAREASPALSAALAGLASREPDVEVRSQLASSAKRLPTATTLAIVRGLVEHDEDVADPHLPLLLWWGIESKILTDEQAVLALWEDPTFWARPLVDQVLLERLMRRFASTGSRRDLTVCAKLLDSAPTSEASKRLMAGFEQAFAGRSLAEIPPELVSSLARQGKVSVPLGLRLGRTESLAEARSILALRPVDPARCQAIVETLGEAPQPSCLPELLSLLATPQPDALTQALLTSLARYPAPEVGEAIVSFVRKGPGDLRTLAMSTLASRLDWSKQFLSAIEAGTLKQDDVPADVVRRLALHRDEQLARAVTDRWGVLQQVTSADAQAIIERTRRLLDQSGGTPYAGHQVFRKTCARCHKLFAEGGDVGPDLTSYKRNDLDNMLLAIIHPSAEIREGYETYQVFTDDGRSITGFIADQDSNVVVLRTAEGQSFTVERNQIDEMEKSPKSVMPDGLIDNLSDEEVRHLFSYLRSTQPLQQ
jgi:putative heme-binding domain-containing protein